MYFCHRSNWFKTSSMEKKYNSGTGTETKVLLKMELGQNTSPSYQDWILPGQP